MEKTIDINGQKVPFKATASTTRRYRQRFGRDLFSDMEALMKNAGNLTGANLEAFENVAFIMAKQADPNIPDDPDEWLDNFEMMNIYEVLPQLIELWGLNMKREVSSRKNSRTPKGK